MQVEISELTVNQLNYAVAFCQWGEKYDEVDLKLIAMRQNYCRNWDSGGSLLAREGICTMCPSSGNFWDARKASLGLPVRYWRGETLLIAAMRCYVGSSLQSDVVDIPDSLN